MATSGVIARLCLVLLCCACLQGGLDEAFDFPSAVAEMWHFGLAPALPLVLLTIIRELGGSILVITGYRRWLGAAYLGTAYLGVSTLAATFVAKRFWDCRPGAHDARERLLRTPGPGRRFFPGGLYRCPRAAGR